MTNGATRIGFRRGGGVGKNKRFLQVFDGDKEVRLS
jgi:hypothetical protein